MNRTILKLTIVSVVICLVNFNCKQQKAAAPETGYPSDVNNIIVTKCSINGCHNAQSAPGADYFDMTNWTTAFKGGTGGAIIIPYSVAQSWLIFFTNTNPENGPALTPTMPYNQAPLSATELQTLENWINNGAPDINGNVAFTGDPNRAKIYATNQGCNVVTVFDANTKLAMRYINVGNEGANSNTAPHQIKISPDNQYWYVIFLDGTIIQKFSAVNDQLVGSINVGSNGNAGGSWTSLCILPDGNHAFSASWSPSGELAYIDLNDFVSTKPLKQFKGLAWPHAINRYRNTLYVTAQYGNFIYKYNNIDSLVGAKFPLQPEQIVLAPGEFPNYSSELDPHEIAFTPDSSEYMVTCEFSNEVRVFQRANDSLLAVIPVGAFPQEIAMSTTTPYAYITCTNAPSQYPLTQGAVCIINYKTNLLVTTLQDGLWQPHGIALDEPHKVAYVLSENYSGGPAPHHVSECGGRNGYVTLIDMNTLDFVPHFKDEISVFPYSAAYRP